MTKQYNIGLDIGTKSVGWAVVDDITNKIIKKGNKYLWGVRLFDEAEQASSRRISRSNRRRYDRRRKRIKLLQKEFSSEINRIDPSFFQKLHESKYHSDDDANKRIKISKDEQKKIKAYNEKYPTIYHLRNHLMNSTEKKDIRLVYLAIHHIIKYRGNFLQTGKTFNIQSLNIKEKLQEIFYSYVELSDSTPFDHESLDYTNLESALLNQYTSDMEKNIETVLSPHFEAPFIKEFKKMVKGNEFKLSIILNIDLEEEIKIKFKDSSFDDNYDEIAKSTDKMIEVLQGFKDLYDMIYLKKIFKGKENASISSLMIEKYTETKDDLKFLKDLFRTTIDYMTQERKELYKAYKKMFKNIENEKKPYICTYERYMRGTISYEEFKKEIENCIASLSDYPIKPELSELYENKYKQRLADGKFMPRINDTENGHFPYQLNEFELKKIIENQGTYYPFLKETIADEDGIETYKLVKLLTFKIPYYVGPLNDTTDKKDVKNKNAWLVKNENVKASAITPYNFHTIINKEETAERFIKRMISNCTYLPKEKAIPADSILYSEFKVRNELKQIKLDGKRISVECQNKIFEELFKKESRTVTEKIFKNYINNSTDFVMYNNPMITGYSANGKFANNIKSYVDFFGNEGIFKDTDYETEDAEQIIEWCTIFEDKSILESKLRKTYPDLSNLTISRILKKKYSGWSNLSKRLLTEIYYEEPGLKKNIMDLMRDTSDNFMQIISLQKYGFQKKFDEINVIKKEGKIDYSVVEYLATSPATKRGIYQALKIVEELVKYLGCEPKNIMIEMARGEEQKKRKDSKKEYLSNIYKKYKDEITDYNRLRKELNGQDELDNKKVFLYFIQEGKSLYSGKPLDINDLDACEIDHIIPRTLIKDDSYDNLALVLRDENQKKAASFVLPEIYRTGEHKIWWNKLKTMGLISSKKYNNLIRNHYSDEDIAGFINRQLVETRQITRHVANILKTYHKDTNIVYLNAGLSSNYRNKHELFKFREINDYHHAHDAYLAAMLGKYKEYFLRNVNFSELRELNYKFYQEGKKDIYKYGYVINSMELESINDKTGEVFNPKEYNNLIENALYRNDIIVTKKTEIRSGELFQQTKNPKGKNGIPIKSNMPTLLYGSYTEIKPACACLVKYTKKKKQTQKIIGLPIYLINSKNESLLSLYIKELLDLEDHDSYTIVTKIPFNTILDIDGKLCSIVGASKTAEICNAKEFKISKEKMKRWKHCLNHLLKNVALPENEKDLYDTHLNEIKDYILLKMENEYDLFKDLVPIIRNKIDDIELNTEIMERVIKELFNLLKFNSTAANLEVIGLISRFGRKAGLSIKNFKILTSSPAGTRKDTHEF